MYIDVMFAPRTMWGRSRHGSRPDTVDSFFGALLLAWLRSRNFDSRAARRRGQSRRGGTESNSHVLSVRGRLIFFVLDAIWALVISFSRAMRIARDSVPP